MALDVTVHLGVEIRLGSVAAHVAVIGSRVLLHLASNAVRPESGRNSI
jgi:hypothetical protein